MNEEDDDLTTKQAEEELGISATTIRYFCRHGLVPHVRRNGARYRVFDVRQRGWIETLEYLRRCGCSLKELKYYAALCRKGNSTIPERKAFLATKKRQLHQQAGKIDENIDFIERREEVFEDIMQSSAETTDYWL